MNEFLKVLTAVYVYGKHFYYIVTLNKEVRFRDLLQILEMLIFKATLFALKPVSSGLLIVRYFNRKLWIYNPQI